MGIDIFLLKPGEIKEDDKADLFHINQGHVGYLREAYDGGPYGTQMLLKEAFDAETFSAQIPARTLRNRLHKKQNTADAARPRTAEVIIAALKMLSASPCAVGTGDGSFDPNMSAQTAINQLTPQLLDAGAKKVLAHSLLIPSSLTVLEAVALRNKLLYDMSDDGIETAIQAFVDFVDLAERLEQETGTPCTIRASY